MGSGKRRLVVAMTTLAILGFSAVAGRAQVFVGCATPTGVIPMPGGIPQPGLPCGMNGLTLGVTVVSGPIAMPPPQFVPPQIAHPGFAAPPMTPGGIAGAVGFNREHQVAANCVAQFGVTWNGAGCITARLTADELNKCFTHGFGGRGCFGDNNTLVSMVRRNLDGMQRERSDFDRGVRALTGISPRDMRDEGILGGRCSFFNNPFGNGC